MSRTVLIGAVVLAACQPQSTRLLLLDESLTQPAELESTARPWDAAGYNVDYRRFYPHLTHADLDRYRVVMILGGRKPAVASDALDAGDLAILTEWTLRGGVVVLGYPPEGAGSFDRWLMNRWLAWSGAGITIGDFALHSARTPRGAPPLQPELTAGPRGAGFDPFPAGVNDLLLVENDAQILARAGPATFVQGQGLRLQHWPGAAAIAATRVDNGLVVVASRSALAAAAGAGSESEQFFRALARWTRRPAEWARIPGAGPRASLVLSGGPGAVAPRPPRRVPPEGVAAERLERPTGNIPRPGAGLPGWITRQGVRALQTDFPRLAPEVDVTARIAALDSLANILDIGAFNLLVTSAHIAPLADSTGRARWERDALRASWQQVAGRLQATSVRWLPLVVPRELEATGDTVGPPCPLDEALWGRIASGMRVLSRFAASRTELIPAVGIELDETTRPWGGMPFCDAAWQAGLAALQKHASLTKARLTALAAVPLDVRYDSLLENGLLAAYDSAVSRIVEQRAATVATDAHRQRRDLLLAVVVPRSPDDWFTRSLVRGLTAPATPALVLSPDSRARQILGTVLHAIRLDPAQLSAGGTGRLGSVLFREQDGFWIGPAESVFVGPSDSLARLIRRLSKER
ncbi:MAG TPA: hypothetical protein VL563_10835 [Gemmatimonadales bacterium]|nr:hypothetical protein [Gemmatimonadales bacterium]